MARRRREGRPKRRFSDEETRAALVQFNEGMARMEEERRRSRAVARAERGRREAAEAVKRLAGDPRASAEDRTAADAAYREAVEAWNRATRGEDPGEAAAAGPEPAAAGPEEEEGEADEADAEAAAAGPGESGPGPGDDEPAGSS